MDTRKIASEYRLGQWAQMIQGRMESGQNIREFCQEAGVRENTYYYWQRKVRQAVCERVERDSSGVAATGISAPGFREVKLVEGQERLALPGVAEPGQLRVEAGAVKLTVDSLYPAEKLAVVLRELVRGC